MKYRKLAQGFTIVELLFSTAIFSAVLMLCLTALVQIGRMYYKGVTTAQTQQAARSVLDELSQGMQFSGDNIQAPTSLTGGVAPLGPMIAVAGDVKANAVGYFCIGNTRYTFAMDRMKDSSNDTVRKTIKHGLWADEPGVCANALASSLTPADLASDTPSVGMNGRDLLSDNMRLLRLIIRQPVSITDGSVWQVLLTVGYGEDDLLTIDQSDPTRRYCAGPQAGTQFCAFSELSTIVKRRISVL